MERERERDRYRERDRERYDINVPRYGRGAPRLHTRSDTDNAVLVHVRMYVLNKIYTLDSLILDTLGALSLPIPGC